MSTGLGLAQAHTSSVFGFENNYTLTHHEQLDQEGQENTVPPS